MACRMSISICWVIVNMAAWVLAQSPLQQYQQGYQKWLAKEYTQAVSALKKAAESPEYKIPATVLLARSYLELKRPSDAVAACNTALESSPEHIDLLYQRSLAYFAQSKWSQASKDLQIIQDRHPKNPYISNQLGNCYAKLQKPEQAMQQWNQAIAVYPKIVSAHQQLSIAYLEQREYDKAQLHLDMVAKLQPEWPLLPYGLGIVCLAREDKETAQSHFEKAVEVNPKHGPSWQQLALLLEKKQQWDSALVAYQKAMANTQEDLQAPILAQQARIRYHLEQYKQAGEDISKAIRLEMNPPAHWFYQHAQIMLAMQKTDDAFNSLDQTIKADAQFWDAYRLQAQIYLSLKKYQQTIRVCKFLENNRQSDAETYYLRGSAQYQLKDYTEALQDFNQATIQASDMGKASAMVKVYLARSECLLRLAENNEYKSQEYWQTALKDLDRSIAFQQDQPTYYAKRSYIRMLLKQYGPSLQDIQMAIDLDEESADFYYQRALLQKIFKQMPEVMKDLDIAISKNSKYHQAYALRALVYAEKQNYEPAIKDCNQAIQLDEKNAAYYLQRGSVLLAQKQWQSVISDMNTGLACEPEKERDVYHFQRARAYLELGKYNDALNDMILAIDRNGEKRAYFELRSQIYTKLQEPEKAADDMQAAQELGN